MQFTFSDFCGGGGDRRGGVGGENDEGGFRKIVKLRSLNFYH